MLTGGSAQLAWACLEDGMRAGDATLAALFSLSHLSLTELVKSLLLAMMLVPGLCRCWPLSTEAVLPSHQPSTPRVSTVTSMVQAQHKQVGHSHC